MFEQIQKLNDVVNSFIWGVPAMILILGIGVCLTIRLRGIQFRKLGFSFKEILGKIFSGKEAKSGSITPFQAMCTALAATVGTGSIAGVAGAISIGGPGAVFWMWISSLLGMVTKYAEVVLAVRFREKNSEGDWIGGPMYTIKNGLGKQWLPLGYMFSIFGVLAVFGTGNATQVNTIVSSIETTLCDSGLINGSSSNKFKLVCGIILCAIVGFILLGGIKSIGKVSEILVPFMAIAYIILGLGVLLLNIGKIPSIFLSIIEGAFKPASVTGGVVGSMFLSMRKGISRGIFSNEAGLGTASIAHAESDTDSPANQGLFGIFEVFSASIIICTMTAFIILCNSSNLVYGTSCGVELTINGFTSTYGSWVSGVVCLAVCCFAFSTVLGWGLYGIRCIEFLFGEKVIKLFIVVYSLVCILGATMDLGLLWDIADTFNGLMAIPNLISVGLLIPEVVRLSDCFLANV